MKDFSIATNHDNRIEAFYIGKGGTVMHAWQLDSGDKTSWSSSEKLFGVNSTGSNLPLTGATDVEACTDSNGQIHVIAHTKDSADGMNKTFHTCYQVPEGGVWHGWYKIVQDKSPI